MLVLLAAPLLLRISLDYIFNTSTTYVVLHVRYGNGTKMKFEILLDMKSAVTVGHFTIVSYKYVDLFLERHFCGIIILYFDNVKS